LNATSDNQPDNSACASESDRSNESKDYPSEPMTTPEMRLECLSSTWIEET
jgi:hypothetical protein